MDMLKITQETLDAVAKGLLSKDQMAKALNVVAGLVGYNLQAPAQQLVPLLAPFRQSIPRRVIAGGTAINWKQITALTMPKGSVAEEAAAAMFTTTVTPRSANYMKLGLRGKVTRMAAAASEGFDPALAKETSNTLLGSMRLESIYMLGGNVTALSGASAGVGPTPTVAEANGKGSLAAATYYVRIAALTLTAAARVQVDYPADYDTADYLLAGRSVASVNPSSDGVTAVGAEGSATLAGGGDALRITWTPVPGAVAYAVFVGTATGAANQKCECIVSQAAVTLTSLVGTGLAASHASVASDSSADALTYDGIIPQLMAAGSGAYKKAVGAALTGSSTKGEVTELQDAFASIFANAKVGKFRIVLGGSDARQLTAKGVVSNAMQIFTSADAGARPQLVLGAHVGSVLNATTGDVCPVETDPWLPGGTILILPTEVPYNDANITTPFDWVGGWDWERFDYQPTPSDGPIFTFETTCWGALRGLFTGGCGILYDVRKG